MKADDIVEAVRSFPGVTRKARIHEVTDSFPMDRFPQVLAAEGEDAAVIDHGGDNYTLFATDGIMESLVKSDPYMAGYFAVLVNINDIAAMGGHATAMVDVMSMSQPAVCSRMIRGMQEGVRRFAVPIVGGHTHPDCSYHALDISVIGTVPKDAVIRSSTARAGDDLVMVMDTDGHYPASVPYAWETTLSKDPKLVREQMNVAASVGEDHLVHAGKDLSNPGALGTAGMMLETSEKGAVIDISAIPRPDVCPDLIHWLLAYQGCGFVYSCDPSCSGEVIDRFAKAGCRGAVVGKVTEGPAVEIEYEGERRVLFDFSKDIITGCKPLSKKDRNV